MFITALILSLVFGATVKASDGRATNMAQNELRKQIHHELNKFNLEDVSGLDKCNTLDISFKVTNDNRIEIINAESANKDLLRFLTELSRNKVIADEILQGKSYKIRFRFVEQ